MNYKNFKLNRSLKSYVFFKEIFNFLITPLFRNNYLFLNRKKIFRFKYFQVGSGSNYNPNFINLGYLWQKEGVDALWDISKTRVSFNDEQFDRIYTEHCLEHISFEDCQKVLREFKRVLRTEIIFRIIIPDGFIFINTYIS